tara:strand:+ start:1046 stop:1741 length:696 start_codon:yes stop_codon:yes gene_type:complete
MKLKDLEIVDTTQKLFDSFNGFMLSSDTKVFGKLLARTLLFNQVKDLPGDIVECGVFKGTGLLTFLKLKKFLCPNSGKKVVGFDYFNSDKLVESLSGQDAAAMKVLFDQRGYAHRDDHRDHFDAFIASCGFEQHEYELVAGDVCKTASEYVSERPGARISLLYLDLDVQDPTYAALEALWPRVVTGGIVVFDEYAFHQWSEANAVDCFFHDKDVEIKSLNYICPSAYVVKK